MRHSAPLGSPLHAVHHGASGTGAEPAADRLDPACRPLEKVDAELCHNPGDTYQDIARRTIGTIACATPCEPRPAFATGPLGRNEHGGYSFIDVDVAACQFAGYTPTGPL